MILIFDTETSGMPLWKEAADHPGQPRIVQLAALLCSDDLEIQDDLNVIVRPDGWTVQEGAARVHGISTERAMDEGRPIAEVMEAFEGLWDPAITVTAYNARFDLKMIRGERRRLGQPDGYGTKPVFDPMKACAPICAIPPTPAMLRAGRGYPKTPKLSEAFEFLCSTPMLDAHDAMADVKATREVLRRLRDEHGVDITGTPEKSWKETA